MAEGIYEKYTSTSVLAGVDVKEFTAWSTKYFVKNILPHFPPSRQIRILEIGCGYGRYLRTLLDQGYSDVYGIDISEEQIRFAREHMGVDAVEQVDALDFLRSTKHSYDVILLLDVMEHLEVNYSIELLRNIYSVLNKGGKLIIQVPNGITPLTPIYFSDITHHRAYSVNSMSQSLRMGGFSKFKHFPISSNISGVPALIRQVFWVCLIKPLIYAYLLLGHGNTMAGIYTSNLLTVAAK